MKKKTRIDHTNIRTRRIYTPVELAKLFNCTSATIRNWIRSGMKIIEGHSKPYLIRGSEARAFILERRKSHKVLLNPGEFYCFRCKTSRASKPENTIIHLTGKIIDDSKQIIIKAICEVCGCRMNHFNIERNLQKLINAGMPIKEGTYILYGNTVPT